MNYKKIFLLIIISIFFLTGTFVYSKKISEEAVKFNKEELSYLKSHNKKTYSLGVFIPFNEAVSNIEDSQYKYIQQIIDLIKKETNINIDIKYYSEWAKNYEDFVNGNLDIILGIQPTDKRKKTMSFTPPIFEDYYTVYCLNNFEINSIADIMNIKVGFLNKDYVIEEFRKKYPNLEYTELYYSTSNELFNAIKNKDIDIAIFSDESHVINKKLLDEYNVKEAFHIKNLALQYSIAANKKDNLIVSIISKVIEERRSELDDIVKHSMIRYNYRILELNEEEIAYIESNPDIKVAYYTNFLPWSSDTPENKLGILYNYMEEIHKEVGLNFTFVNASFSDFTKNGKCEDVDLLMLLKNESRKKKFLFTQPIINEIDSIYGLSESPFIHDLYDLESKRIAVLNGSWHEKWLQENLSNADILKYNTISEAFLSVQNKKADYFIAQPTIFKYIVRSHDTDNIIKKGITATDTKRAFAITKNNTILQSIFNKAMNNIDSNHIVNTAINELPITKNKDALRMKTIIKYLIIGICIVLLIISSGIYYAINKNKSLKEEASLIYIDSLTSVNNRFYLEKKEKEYRKDTEIAVIMFDLNKFKSINDNFGHTFGDAYLIKFAEELNSIFRKSSIIRYGGDEFIILFDSINTQLIESRISKLNEILKKSIVSCKGNKKEGIEVSIGYALSTEGDNLSDLIHAADYKMYIDKNK